MMKICAVCGKEFDPDRPPETPAEEAGAFMARELWDDVGELCPECLANRGTLGMMYCRELFR
ncbi:hypothetical protein [Trichloromonas sp.]|uniref:hypothetical protein n=1 Tax=Trichloromonas sp. TaxID=3069249 RepID=UPI002A3D3926|nr:hypothetical protein [Trichloromonas sp.]